MIELFHGDCAEVMKNIHDNSVDSCVTDPPYGLTSIVKRFGKKKSAPAKYGKDGRFSRLSSGFMGQKWDGSGIEYNVDMWREVYRVLKPGGHLLSFGGTRTYHRMVCAIEDAGFEIRDMIQWIYGQGFPKSHNISKAIDRLNKVDRVKLGIAPTTRSNTDVDNQVLNWGGHGHDKIHYITTPATSEAIKWDGWGTALKPANEPICLARKPISESTIALNVLKWGTGGINIDSCRIELNGEVVPINKLEEWTGFGQKVKPDYIQKQNTKGRWPANVIFDEKAGRILDEQSNKEGASRFFYCAKASKKERNAGLEKMKKVPVLVTGLGGDSMPLRQDGTERKMPMAQNYHPTVKPVALMRWLCQLITPPKGVIIDPFMGSGSTGIACVKEEFSFIGIDNNSEYFKIAEARMAHAQQQMILL